MLEFLCKLLQHEGEFVITFPRSFHSGFSMGPNIGEAVNFASHDWISYGADANERYRSFGRPAVFSHDRLTLTMANHLKEQKSYTTCKQLLEELERVVEEELKTRQKLIESGVRDVSHLITLPRNVLEQLDEESADYDDKRLCHACKHICFFSAVACECSQSKVSCLRHSHFMCRCPTDRKYLMIWSDDDELKSTLKRVRDQCKSLKTAVDEEREASLSHTSEPSDSLAPGVGEDLARHKNEEINLENLTSDFYRNRENKAKIVESPPRSKPLSPTKYVRKASKSVRKVSDEVSDVSDDDEVEVVGVVTPMV
jgi:histone demethylase JARID1